MNRNVVEKSIRRTAQRWRMPRGVQYSAKLGGAVCVLILLLGMAARAGWIHQPSLFSALLVLLLGGAGVGVLIVVVTVASSKRESRWLAGKIEESDPSLQDRLNTLVFLEPDKEQAAIGPFYRRIRRQAQVILTRRPASVRFPWLAATVYTALFVAVLACTIGFYARFDPYQTLVDGAKAELQGPAPEPGLQVELAEAIGPAEPEAVVAAEQARWGEVLIADPAKDMQVTKVDVVPLQVEVAASEALEMVGWSAAVNGGSERVHELPPPAGARFATYSPTIYMDKFSLSDWDVLTYYARARTTSGTELVSEVYFLEVRPFREDILKVPGGEGGEVYQILNGLTLLIERQQQIIRETHQFLQQADVDQAQQDGGALAEAEADLSRDVGHLYSWMSAEMENMPIGHAQDHLAKAERSLAGAAEALGAKSLDAAAKLEREGLADLIATRKVFQKTVSENPKRFDQPQHSLPPPEADQPDPLRQIAEFRDEEKAVQESLRDAVDQQRSIAERAGSAFAFSRSDLHRDQLAIQEQLEALRSGHPRAFEGLEVESREAGDGMERTASALAGGGGEASDLAQQAAEKLEKLRQGQEQQAAKRQLTDAYRLKQRLDQQIQSIVQSQQAGGEGEGEGEGAPVDLAKLASDARETLDQLRQTSEQRPGRDGFGQPLKDALDKPEIGSLERMLGVMGDAQSEAEKQTIAPLVGKALGQVSEAFEQSTPQPQQMVRRRDALKPSQDGRMQRGIGQLRSLVQRMEGGSPSSEEDGAKQGREALANLQDGMRGQPGGGERHEQLLGQLEEVLSSLGEPGELENLKNMIAQLQSLAIEMGGQSAAVEQPEVTSIEPAKMAPAYRDRIQRYFEKLSEK